MSGSRTASHAGSLAGPQVRMFAAFLTQIIRHDVAGAKRTRLGRSAPDYWSAPTALGEALEPLVAGPATGAISGLQLGHEM